MRADPTFSQSHAMDDLILAGHVNTKNTQPQGTSGKVM